MYLSFLQIVFTFDDFQFKFWQLQRLVSSLGDPLLLEGLFGHRGGNLDPCNLTAFDALPACGASSTLVLACAWALNC